MKYVILLEDSPTADAGIRKAHMAAHLDFLEAHADKVEAAGPLSEPSGAGAGGLWIVEAASEAEARQLVHEDPFWPTGLRQFVTVLRWTRVFADGSRLDTPG